MEEIAIRVEGLSKKFSIGKIRSGSLRESFSNWFRKNRYNSASDFWALSDVSFEIEKGDVIGIIGRNGAGKSTLLKILSRITEPTQGRIEIDGRVASLLEVGTGFHPELTGKENIFLNGTILGMSRNEIKAKFDEIVNFSGVEKFIDTPVKHYSSGMYVRLAFAVAAYLEPEILMIDEVLAVGDYEFQKKCLGKMTEVSEEGRTVLFVSHNLGAIQALCNSCMLIDKGQLNYIGDVKGAIEKYIIKQGNDLREFDLENFPRERGANEIIFKKISFDKVSYFPEEDIEIEISPKRTINKNFKDIQLGLHIVDQLGNQIYHLSNIFLQKQISNYSDQDKYIFKILNNALRPGVYSIWLWLSSGNEEQDFITQGITLKINDGNIYNYSRTNIISGVVQPKFEFLY